MNFTRSATHRRWHATGQGLAEYALILTLISVLVIGALTFLGDGIAGTLSAIANVL